MYSDKFKRLWEPVNVGNTILKSRMTASPSRPHFMQGPENYPSRNAIFHYANKAKNGAALVNISGLHGGPSPNGTKDHDGLFDFTNAKCQHYIAQMAEAVHFYGSKIQAGVGIMPPHGYDVSAGLLSHAVVGDGSVAEVATAEITDEMLKAFAEDIVAEMKILRYDCGFDAAFFHMTYRGSVLGRLLSPLTNHRTDRYGGSLEARAAYCIELADRIKQECGNDFIIEGSISGHDPLDMPGGWTLEDSIAFARLAKGHFDILQIRAPDIDSAHPIPFELNPTPWLYMAETIKKANPGPLIAAIGGFSDPKDAERALEEGKADLIAMARSYISNPEFGKLVYEGRDEDLTPCLRCNKCHKSSWADPWISVCSVNPTWGMEDKLPEMTVAPAERKKIAIVGGGPAGMSEAIWLSDRGHDVTIYERLDHLGGLLDVTRKVDFKWTLQNFKNYLIRQVRKRPIAVELNCAPSREELIHQGYSEVIVAVGSEPVIPSIPGVDGGNVMTALDAYEKHNQLGERVVVVGGGEIGVETAMFLAKQGHSATVLEMRGMLAPDSTPVHYYSMFQKAWESTDGFSSLVNARVTGITLGEVIYEDQEGQAHKLPCDGVVISAGMRAKREEALAYYDPAYGFHMIGDCVKAANIQKLRRSAYGLAMNI